ncbi:NUDIX hydrolase [Candidatus Pelagibacter sp.]|nr:NUDIX hydrolase [Candidatus Pelagibacter sp.]
MKKKLFSEIYLEIKKFKKKQKYFFLSTPKISIIIPKIKNKFIVVSQKRIPINRTIFEFPGGIVDKGKTPMQIAFSELKEETGYISLKKPKKIISFYPDPGRLNCSYECYYTDSLKKIGLPEKGIKLHLLNKRQILHLIQNKKFSHSCHVSAFLYLCNQNKYLSDK